MSVELYREGSRRLRLRFNIADINVNRVSIAFQVEPQTLYLKEEFGDLSYWANEAGRFNLQHLQDNDLLLHSLQVMGNDREQASTNAPLPSLSYTPTNRAAAVSGPSTITSAPKSYWGSASKKSNFSCKVVYSMMEKNAKGAQFTTVKQTFITLDEDSANLPNVTAQAKVKFGEDVILVAGNGLPIEDEPGTRGSSFWKCASRKIYAIKAPSRKRPSTRPTVSLSTSDESDGSDTQHKPSKDNKRIKPMKNMFQEIAAGINDIKVLLADLTTVTSAIKLPISVVKSIKDTFKCKICHSSPMKAPVVAGKCCNTLIGCSACVNKWYEGDGGLEKTCPNCREPRGYAHTSQFKGIDDFLGTMTTAIYGENTDDSE